MYRILPKISPPPRLFSAVDLAQTGEGADFRICAMHLEYKPPLADSLTNTRLDIYGAYSRFEPRTQQQELALSSRGRPSQTDS